jgi:small subunit ribosomal protein S10
MSQTKTKSSVGVQNIKTKQRIRIRLKSFDFRKLDLSAEKIISAAQKSGAKVLGPIPLPTQKKRWCVLKSPHVNKRGGEHYEIRIHKRMIDILDPPSSTVEALMQLDLSSGVSVEIKLR